MTHKVQKMEKITDLHVFWCWEGSRLSTPNPHSATRGTWEQWKLLTGTTSSINVGACLASTIAPSEGPGHVQSVLRHRIRWVRFCVCGRVQYTKYVSTCHFWIISVPVGSMRGWYKFCMLYGAQSTRSYRGDQGWAHCVESTQVAPVWSPAAKQVC